jgi:hypothetical protein
MLVILGGVACAQTPASPSPLVASKAANSATSNTVSPNVIAPRDEGSVRPLPDMPPLQPGKVTLMGGTIQKVDHLRDRLVLQVFGGKRMTVLFDERTHVFQDGKPVSVDAMKNGERAYVDTTLDGVDIFAKNIRVSVQGPTGQSSGQIVDFRPRHRELIVRDALSPDSITMHLADDAVIMQGDRTVRPEELRPGTLVNLAFSPSSGKTPVVRQISILATPGAMFVFAGRIEHVDLRRGLLVVSDPRDNKTYDVYFDPASRHLAQSLRPGVDVTVQATFDGARYQSRDITVNSASAK